MASDDSLDLAMRARMAEEDAAWLREAIHAAVFPSSRGYTSDDTLIKFAVQRIEHSHRIAPDNPLGRIDPAVNVTSDAAVAVLRELIVDLRALRTSEGDRLALIVGDLLTESAEEAS